MLICFSGMGTSENMRRVSLLILVAVVATVTVSAQTGTSGIYSESLAITRSGLYVLGGWSVANIAAGAYGWAAKDGQTKYFGQMNLFWNVVNLSIAGIGLYGNYNADIARLLPAEMISEMMKTEKIFLINAGADVVIWAPACCCAITPAARQTDMICLRDMGMLLFFRAHSCLYLTWLCTGFFIHKEWMAESPWPTT
jgi:hypothetical protein